MKDTKEREQSVSRQTMRSIIAAPISFFVHPFVRADSGLPDSRSSQERYHGGADDDKLEERRGEERKRT